MSGTHDSLLIRNGLKELLNKAFLSHSPSGTEIAAFLEKLSRRKHNVHFVVICNPEIKFTVKS
jgi:hypothetical protein